MLRTRFLTRVAVLALTLAAFSLPGMVYPGYARKALEPTPLAELCERAVTGVMDLHRGLGRPSGTLEPEPIRKPQDFDVNETFKILDRLKVEPGYKLDYVIFSEFFGGKPILYAYPDTESPYRTYHEYAKARGVSSLRDNEEYLKHIVVEDNEGGFLQFALMRIMGGQFYLLWHAGYDDVQPICTSNALERLLASGEQRVPGRPMTDDQKAKARALDPEPVVTLGDERVTVSLLTFTKWGGFIEVEYEFDRVFPHLLRDTRKTTLVEYDCGIRF